MPVVIIKEELEEKVMDTKEAGMQTEPKSDQATGTEDLAPSAAVQTETEKEDEKSNSPTSPAVDSPPERSKRRRRSSSSHRERRRLRRVGLKCLDRAL